MKPTFVLLLSLAVLQGGGPPSPEEGYGARGSSTAKEKRIANSCLCL